MGENAGAAAATTTMTTTTTTFILHLQPFMTFIKAIERKTVISTSSTINNLRCGAVRIVWLSCEGESDYSAIFCRLSGSHNNETKLILELHMSLPSGKSRSASGASDQEK